MSHRVSRTGLWRSKHAGGAGAAAAALLAVSALAAVAQYPGQITDKDKNAPTMRAVAVLEWVGDLAHPKASRLVPITVWDGQNLQDGGIYLARPQPLALDSETEYELQKDGKNIGFFDIRDAARQQDSWIGLGAFRPLPTGPSPQQLAMERRRQKVDVDDGDSDTPILHRKHHADDNDSSSGSGSGSNGPTLHKAGDAGSSTAGSGNGPTLHKGGDADDSGDNASAPAPDPDRPRLHADTDDSASASAKSNPSTPSGDDVAHVSDLPAISDPDRPRLRRGEPAEYGPTVKPTLVGLPADLDQDVAISDTGAIKQHPWDYSWPNPADEAKMKSALEDMARKELGLDPPAPAPARATARRTSVHRKATPPPPPPPAPLVDEQFRVFELQYGAGATLVLSAHTAGSGEQQKFVTLVAQPDLYGGVVVLLKNTTDGAHLDVTPRMRLIDAVDALADNRGELLFELRGQTQRQFALYRVLRGQATRIFTTGASYWGAAGE